MAFRRSRVRSASAPPAKSVTLNDLQQLAAHREWPSVLVFADLGPQTKLATREIDVAPFQSAARGLSQEQIEHEILNSRDLSKKGPPLLRLAYAIRTASKAIALSTQ